MYTSSGENSCVGAASSVSLERDRERELISVREVEQNAKHSKCTTCEQTGSADRGLPQLLHYHNTQKQHLARCCWRKLKPDWHDLQIVSSCSLWPLWPPSSLWNFAAKLYTVAVVEDFSRIIWQIILWCEVFDLAEKCPDHNKKYFFVILSLTLFALSFKVQKSLTPWLSGCNSTYTVLPSRYDVSYKTWKNNWKKR